MYTKIALKPNRETLLQGAAPIGLCLGSLGRLAGMQKTVIKRRSLSQYIFCTIAQNIPLLKSGSIRFFDKADEEVLRDYLCD